MIIANPAQLFSFLANEKNKFPLTAIKGSVARGFQLDETELFPYLMKFQQWLLEFNEYERERASATLHPSESAVNAVWVKGDYDKLWEQIQSGIRTVCYVDYYWNRNDKSKVYRDICTIRKEHLEFSARGIGYGGVAHMEGDSKQEFLEECERLNVEWLDETGTAAQGKYLLRETIEDVLFKTGRHSQEQCSELADLILKDAHGSQSRKEEAVAPLTDDEIRFMEECDIYPHANGTAKILTENDEGAFLENADLLRLANILYRYAKTDM